MRLIVLSILLLNGACWAQKPAREEMKIIKEHHFDDGFTIPSAEKRSTLILEDGTEVKGFVDKIDFTRRNLMREITFKNEEIQKVVNYDIDRIKEAYLLGSQLDKMANVGRIISRGGTGKHSNMRKATEDGEIYFIKKTVTFGGKKKGEEEVLLQLINPGFDDYITVYNDPTANESQGIGLSSGLGGINLGGGVLLSYFIEKDGKVFWLHRKDFKKHYEDLFGDHPEFLEKYPLRQVKWAWLSGLILEYTKMRLENS